MSHGPLKQRARTIAALNDQFRKTLMGGTVLVTAGVQVLGCDFVAQSIEVVRGFEAFTGDNDPYGEHDFGAVMIDGLNLFWKIDAYDPMLEYASSDPSDPAKTRRVLTIMLAEEY